MFKWIVLLRYPSHKRRDENSTLDLEVNVTWKVTVFSPLGRLPSVLGDFWFSFDHESLLLYEKVI